MNKKHIDNQISSEQKVVKDWENFVERIINGTYEGNENEYWNDLDTREIIDKIGYGGLEDVKKADEKFKGTLIHTNIRVWGNNISNRDWWNFGYPKNLQGYLKDYFSSDPRLK